MQIIETERLILREMSADDKVFFLELINEPAWKQNIGDRGVRTEDGAREYILERIVSSYEKFSFGLWLVELKESDVSTGICGLIKRDTLKDVDIGFAFLERFWSKGYAVESALAVMDYAKNKLALKRVAAITVPENLGSIKVLEKIGMKFEKMIKMPGDEKKIKFFARDF
jgi:RimJ/RimL family protein N-acetyltransferase